MGFDSKHNIGGEGHYYKFNQKKKCDVQLNVGIIQHTYTLFTTIAHHGVGYLKVNNINKSWNNLQI